MKLRLTTIHTMQRRNEMVDASISRVAFVEMLKCQLLHAVFFTSRLPVPTTVSTKVQQYLDLKYVPRAFDVPVLLVQGPRARSSRASCRHPSIVPDAHFDGEE